MEARAEVPSAAWLTPRAQELAVGILNSYRQAYSQPLLVGLCHDAQPLQWAQALFQAETLVMAHDGQDPSGDPGPRLIYANSAALRLWQRPWAELVGMPSRLTAEPAQRTDRARALASVQHRQAIKNYRGVRIDSHGRRFQINGARVWTLWDPSGQPCGQAAAFSDWHWIEG